MRLEKKALDKLFRRRDRIEIPDFQRGKVWDLPEKQAFLDTIQRNWFVPVIFLRTTEDEHSECIDGQQRLNAIFGFYSNEFPLSRKLDAKNGGKYYQDLPDKTKDLFDDYELHIVEIQDAEEGEVEELFQRLQLGVPLNAGEKLNSLGGDMRNFAVELSKHKFLEKKVTLRNSRFSFLSIVSQICLLETEGMIDAKYKNIEKFYKNHSIFNKDSPKGRKIVKVLDLLNVIFDHKIPELSNRASVVSIYLLVSDLLEKTTLKGKEPVIKKFYIEFLKKLSLEVEKGPLAKDTELIIYQSAVNQAADSKESIQRRQDILMKRLVAFDPDFAQFIEREAIDDRLAALENEKEIRNLSTDVLAVISEINSISTSKSMREVFKITNKMLKRIGPLSECVADQNDFGNFIDGMYEIIYEGAGSLSRIPVILKGEDSVCLKIKFLRADIRHDLDHGNEKEVIKKKERLARIYGEYSNKSSIDAIDCKQFVNIQRQILEESKSFLLDVKNYYIQKEPTPTN